MFNTVNSKIFDRILSVSYDSQLVPKRLFPEKCFRRNVNNLNGCESPRIKVILSSFNDQDASFHVLSLSIAATIAKTNESVTHFLVSAVV